MYVQLKIEFLIPKKFNNGDLISTVFHAKTSNDLARQFGSYTEDPTSLLGSWFDPNTKRRYKDENFTYWVLCDNTEDNMKFLQIFKETLKDRYKQIDVLIYYIEVNRI